MEYLTQISNRLINAASNEFFRELYHAINWQHRLIEIRGSRGVGKTTLLLQQGKSLITQGLPVLYVSLDNAWFFQNRLSDLVDDYSKYGGKYLLIDEVHKYPTKERGLDWSQEIKNIYDSYPDLYIIYTGSSILQLYTGLGDLSRRKSTYRLYGLSFREYLRYENITSFPILPLNDLLKQHASITAEITSDIKVLPAFKQYLRQGYYPFYKEAQEKYIDQLNEVINVIIETDIPSVSEISFDTSNKLKKLLALLSVSVPYSPNLSKLARQLEITDTRTLLKYLNLLEKAELIQTLGAKASGNQLFNKPEKIYTDNTNLMYALSPNNVNEGTLREVFAINQLKQHYTVNYPKQGDIIVNNSVMIEIGGKNKTGKQLSGIDHAFIASDNIETGFGSKFPLWLLGFLN